MNDAGTLMRTTMTRGTPRRWRNAAGLLVAAAAGLLAGCVNLAPVHTRPAAPVPPTLSPSPEGAAPAAAVLPTVDWRGFITEPRLRGVVALALEHNRDLRIASQNIERARALYRIQRADLFPAVDASGAATRQQVRTASSQGPATQYSAEIGFSSYELDFFGRVRNLNAAALEEFLATDETRRSAQISLVAEVATAWLTLAADLERLQLAQDTLENQQRAFELSRRMQALGATSGLVLAQAQTTVESARLDVARYTSQVALDRNALVLLAGTSLDGADLWPVPPLDTAASALVAVPAGLPSEVLQQRPDVLAAEHRLKGASADIGSARAAFFPRIALTTEVGTASSTLSGLFKGGSGVWSFGPSISLPLFDAGANRAGLDAARAQREIELSTYEKAVQVAFREVADALAQREGLAGQIDAQQALLGATQKTLDLSTALFKNGASGFLEVLDAQRSLYAARQSAIGLRLSEQANRITLYKVLGGGWR
jgi:multidrug efflux system outer membrane protein